jgi:hypothetical protein
MLHRSADFTVRSAWEQVELEGRHLQGPVIVGDFYGNPSDAVIDVDQRWCLQVGCGLIAYRLGEPWTPYSYDRPDSPQWWEHRREPDDVLWLEFAWLLSDGSFAARTTVDRNSWTGHDFRVLPEHRRIEEFRSWTATEQRARAALLESLAGLELKRVETGRDLVMYFGGPEKGSVVASAGVDVYPLPRQAHLDMTVADLVGRRVRSAWTVDNGGLDIFFEPSPADLAAQPRPMPGTQILVQSADAAGGWRASLPGGELVAPGFPGWPDEQPPFH